ncbi:phosphoenolpyruvate synthase [Chryseotalea sanaruensis]|uniref:Phosphoenolpyruvate synthase n=1 Tax=Chryseotalea sanaruensis TaxID=2482724 RepID=A0A401U6D2_9BACT|nr:phosphoenolpyruvate synthase [Chryseotalea sanaruensis]GCC50400.1 phosphoenolpyruvate synthase [Chryseotalea sanaruensis]
MNQYIKNFKSISADDVSKVGGKNASLGVMINNLSSFGVHVPNGFAITTDAYKKFLEENLLTNLLQNELDKLERESLKNLALIGERCRSLVLNAKFPEDIREAIIKAYESLTLPGPIHAVAVRSSATAEDSPTASFAGQHESYLNVSGAEKVIEAVQKCYASLFNDRAIKYRQDNGFKDMQVALSVGVQLMVRSDKASAGVIFTIEPENGNENLIYLTGAWGLGESVVQGAVNTDEFYLFKPALENNKQAIVYRKLGSKEQKLIYAEPATKNTKWVQTTPLERDQFILTDDEVQKLGKWCLAIERHYKMPMDIEWAKDGASDKLFIVQARPETVHSQHKAITLKEFSLMSKEQPLLTGKAVGRAIVSGKVRIIKSLADGGKVNHGDIIVADITNPDWNALLKKAVCIVTNKGGRTSHASIIARELGIPAVVGTMSATEILTDGQEVTVSCATGDVGAVYNGKLQWQEKETPLDKLLVTKTKAMLILADPEKALLYATYPNQGVGLLRMEFIISNTLQIHPMALVKYNTLPDNVEKKQIEALTRHYIDKQQFFIDKLAESIGLVAAAFYPREVIVRMSDFKTNEYAKLLGGKLFEPEEENPMLGFRGASRYYHENYAAGFGLECAAIKKVRDDMLLTNVKIMIPFCRTIEEANKVLAVMAANQLKRKENGLQIYVMAEIPSNVLLANKFAQLFDGFSIGSNDLTQLTLGLDRDSAIVSHLFNENDESVKMLIRTLIEVAHQHGTSVGLCGQAPSDYPEFASFLVSCGIDSISFNPDALITGIQNIYTAEHSAKEKLETV